MTRDFFKNIKDAVFSVLPITIIMLIVSLLLNFNIVSIVSILISSILIIMGIALFTYGADLSMMEIGSSLGSKLIKTKKPLFIIFITFLVGIIITVAEPDLKVLADQLNAIDSNVFILCVGVGIGLFLSIVTLCMMYKFELRIVILVFYALIIVMMLFCEKEMIPVAFDAGGVTTGPMSVPFIMALGVGLSQTRKRSKSKNNSFGLIALCSIGPILTVLIFSLFLKSEMNYTYNLLPEMKSFSELFTNYGNLIIPTLKDVTLSLVPILILFIIFNIITKTIKGKKLKGVIVGLIVTFLGLSLFFVAVNATYMYIAYIIGSKMYLQYEYLLIPFGMIIGYVIVTAEPAVSILTDQIEEITQGGIPKKIMNRMLAIGVSIAIGISIIRVLTGISILYFLIIGYIIALLLMFVTPKIFTMVAFDAGGAVSGPMTTSFLLPLIIGVCYQHGGNILTDAFGLVALVAMSPLLTIQILGLAFNNKNKLRSDISMIDETIVEFGWGNS